MNTPAVGSVCLFCGSSNSVAPMFLEAASAFGRSLAAGGVRLVYGGGGVGLMGAAARAAHDAGGDVLGVIPEFLCRREVIYDAVRTVVVPNMHERKRIMFEESDAFVVMPGGIGTLEEVVELLSWKRLDLHRKPIVFVDMDGFWQPFFALIEHTVEQRFTPDFALQSWSVVPTVAEVLPLIESLLARGPEQLDEGEVVEKA